MSYFAKILAGDCVITNKYGIRDIPVISTPHKVINATDKPTKEPNATFITKYRAHTIAAVNNHAPR